MTTEVAMECTYVVYGGIWALMYECGLEETKYPDDILNTSKGKYK